MNDGTKTRLLNHMKSYYPRFHRPVDTMDAVQGTEMIIQWIDNLESAFGKEAVMNQLPNNSYGRLFLIGLIDFLED